MKKTLEMLREAVRQAEQELDAATSRTALNAAAKRLVRAKQELKAAEDARSGSPSGSGRATAAATLGRA